MIFSNHTAKSVNQVLLNYHIAILNKFSPCLVIINNSGYSKQVTWNTFGIIVISNFKSYSFLCDGQTSNVKSDYTDSYH